MAAWQCINHCGGTLSVSRLKTVRVNTSSDMDATVLPGRKFVAGVPPHWQTVPSLFEQHIIVTAFSFQIPIFLSGHFERRCLYLQSSFFIKRKKSKARRQNCHYFLISQAQQRFPASDIQPSHSEWNNKQHICCI